MSTQVSAPGTIPVPAGSDHPAADPVRVELLQQTVRRAFKLLVTSADTNSPILDMPLGQVRCLRRIIEQDGCKLVDLARETNLSVPNASRLVDRLVRNGLVTRQRDPCDRRAVRLHATSESRAMIDAIQEQRLRHIAHATRAMTEQQIDAAIEALQSVIAAAEYVQPEWPSTAAFEDFRGVGRRDLTD